MSSAGSSRSPASCRGRGKCARIARSRRRCTRTARRICLQLLHAGRYAYHPLQVAPSKLKAPINPFTPRALSARGVERQIDAYASAAQLAREAGYDGVELMGSEGYLINQFVVARTNRRNDRWGGDAAQRMRFAVEIVRRVREACGPDFIIIYRLSLLDLVEGGSDWDEIVQQAQAVEAAGATHPQHRHRLARSAHPDHRHLGAARRLRRRHRQAAPARARCRWSRPTASTCPTWPKPCSPRAAPTWCRWRARCWPIRNGRTRRAPASAHAINTCIACNQACLDHVFENKNASCLVNPRACAETELNYTPTPTPQAHRRGRRRSRRPGLRDGGGRTRPSRDPVRCRRRDRRPVQPRQAIPGKEEFHETLRYFRQRIEDTGVELKLSTIAPTRRPCRLRRGRARHRRHSARRSISPARTMPRS